eukprot:SAG22_NODE_121_length_19129_cov_36.644614_14_plen_79_part_00
MATNRRLDARLQAAYYHYNNDTMRCGLVVFAFMLVDVTEGDGGLVVVPGEATISLPRARVIPEEASLLLTTTVGDREP